MDAEPAFIGDFLDAVEDEHGDIATWLTDRAGVPAETIDRWRRLFVGSEG
jgi:hypothetical protein